jgi:hypothetical protein
MRMFLPLLALFLALPQGAEAAPKNRKIANKTPSRVLNFVCRESAESPETVVGMAHMSVDLRDETVGAFSMSVYVKNEKGYAAKTITGTYTTVPGGFIYRAKWPSATGDYTLLHVHPGDKSSVPGLGNKQGCEVTGQLDSQ